MSTKKEKKPHLGRGLESLLGPMNPPAPKPEPVKQDTPSPPQPAQTQSRPPAGSPQTPVRMLNISSIQANPYQPRTEWNDDQLEELASSIKASGVIQPIIVRSNGVTYELIAGERRLRASGIAGLTEIPAIVRNATDEQMLELALVENIQRSDLNPMERAKAYSRFIESFSLTHAEAAEKLGQSRSVITNHLRLLDLPREIQQMLLNGQLTMGHAKAILSLPTDDLRNKLANRALAGRLSVREVEKLVNQKTKQAGAESKTEKTTPPYLSDLQTRLADTLGTKVTINANKNGQKGKLVIDFYSLDQFDDITKRLGLDNQNPDY